MFFFIVLLLFASNLAAEIGSTPTTAVDEAQGKSQLRGVTLLSANLRDAPSMQSEIVVVAREGALLDILEERGQWYRVRTEAGVEAWIHKSLLHPTPVHLAQESHRASAPSTPILVHISRSPASLGADPPVASEPIALPQELSAPPLLLAQPLGVDEPSAPAPEAAFLHLLALIATHVQENSGYFLAGLAVILIISTGLQLRAARQLKQTTRDVSQILDLVEAIQAESLSEPALNMTPATAMAPPSGAVPSASWAMRELTPVERVVLDAITKHGEVHERQLGHILEEKGCPPRLIKAVIGDLVRKTAADGLPWVEARYTQGRFVYRLRLQKPRGSRHEHGPE